MYIRCNYVIPNLLVVEATKGNPILYEKRTISPVELDPIIDNYFHNKVPIGILLDYIEENYESLFDQYEYNKKDYIIQELRLYYKDLTELYWTTEEKRTNSDT